MQYIPDPHQLEATAHLLNNPRALLFLEMALGKTAATLDYLYTMHYEEGAISKTLIVAPDKVARLTWPEELRKWDFLHDARYSLIEGTVKERLRALTTDVELYVIGVDNLVWLIDLYIKQPVSRNTGLAYGKWYGALPFDCVVLDELTLFKGRDSNRFLKFDRALRLSNVPYRIGMTGTPTPNGYIDLWAMLMLIDGGERLGTKFGDYCAEYFTTRGNGMVVYEYKPKVNAHKIIAHKIRDITLTMKTRDHVELPPVTIRDIELDLSPFDLELYETLEEEYLLEFEDGATSVKTPADLTNKLLQLSGGALYEDLAEGRVKRYHTLNDNKLCALIQLLERVPENFIIVYQFRHELERIKAALPYAREMKKAQDKQDWNDGKIRALILHPKGGGHGLNLQFGGFNMVWFTPTWNLEHWLQTVARLPRRGAERPIDIWRLLMKGTRDMSVRKRINSKEEDQNFLMREIKQLRQKYGKVR